MVNHYPLSQVTEFETFRHNTQTRDAIMQEKGIEGLASFLQQHVLVTYNPHSHLQTQTPLLQQLAKHYSKETIATAIATAWINESDTFELHKLGFVERWGKERIVIVAIAMLLIPSMMYAFIYIIKHHPEYAAQVFVGLEPFLALPGLILSWLMYKLVMKVWK